MSPIALSLPTATSKYMVCVDSKEESKAALHLACMKAKARGIRVAMLHVVTPADFQTLGSVADLMREERKAEGEKLLNILSEEAYDLFEMRPVPLLREGAIGDEILAAALEDSEINMIAIGVAQQNSGRGKLAAWLASQLGHKLLVPLLMIPGNLTDEQLQSII